MKSIIKGIPALLCLVCTTITTMAQDQFYNVITQELGWPQQPADTDPIAPLEDYGTLEQTSEVGYQVGDTIANFTVYDFNGNPLTLSDELTGDKPVVLMSSSVSCIRFRNLFDVTIESQETTAARQYVLDHLEDFNWIFIYNLEAHPSDGNCPSNCPPVPTLDTAVTQGPDYLYRRYAMHNWETHGAPYDFPFTMYADNPDNSVYNHFFRRAFGILVISCEGVVLARGDWANQFLTLEQDYMESLRTQEYQTCEVEGETVSIAESNAASVQLYPNPSSGNFRLNGIDGNGRIQIFEPSGRVAFISARGSLSAEFTTTNLATGYYIVHVMHESGKTVQLPLVVE